MNCKIPYTPEHNSFRNWSVYMLFKRHSFPRRPARFVRQRVRTVSDVRRPKFGRKSVFFTVSLSGTRTFHCYSVTRHVYFSAAECVFSRTDKRALFYSGGPNPPPPSPRHNNGQTDKRARSRAAETGSGGIRNGRPVSGVRILLRQVLGRRKKKWTINKRKEDARGPVATWPLCRSHNPRSVVNPFGRARARTHKRTVFVPIVYYRY